MNTRPQTPAISRRGLARLLMAGLSGAPLLKPARAATAPPLAVERLLAGLSSPSTHRRALSYRADAVIVLLAMPVYRRAGVGSGFASLAEIEQEDGRRYSLRFAGASRPDRAAGLDRVGIIHEAVVERGAVLAEAAYFGVITSSAEETLEQGRRSLGKTPAKWNQYTAIDGHSRSGRTRSAVAHFRLPSSGESNTSLIQQARANFQISQPEWREHNWPAERAAGAPPTFLYALLRALQCPQRFCDAWYVYSERSYRLRLQKVHDRQQGLRFAERGLTSHPEQIIEVRGRIREESLGRETAFRLWIEQGSPSALPLRIEFQPRSYLRLSFEVDPQSSPTPFEEDL